jgi:hypothetical protein
VSDATSHRVRKPHLYSRDFQRVRKACEELIRQCDYYERNSQDGSEFDEIRSLHIWNIAKAIERRAALARRRWYRENPDLEDYGAEYDS